MSGKRRDLSFCDKVQLLNNYDKLGKCTQREAALKLNISQPLLNKLLKQRDEILQKVNENTNVSLKRRRVGKAGDVQEALLRWFKQARLLNVPIDNAILIDKATKFAEQLGVEEFTPTIGWLSRWKKRENITFKRCHGEKQDANYDNAGEWIKDVLPNLLREFDANDVYNIDESGLYFRALPDSTFELKGTAVSGGKRQMQRLTVLFGCNMTGTDKLRPLVIGKSMKPRCLKGVNKFPLDYTANANAWMTSSIFTDFMTKWDKQLKKRKIAVVMDNCTAHPPLNLSNINMVFLPANTTSIIQPLDQGIIRAVKAHYRKKMRFLVCEGVDNGVKAGDIAKKVNVLEAMHMLAEAWEQLTPLKIQNCFRKAGFMSNNEEGNEASTIDEPLDPTIEQWVDIDQDLPTFGTVSDAEIVAELSATVNSENDSDNEQETPKPPTSSEIRSALDVIKRALQEHGDDESFQSFYKINYKLGDYMYKTKNVQTKITDFLK